MSSTYTRRAHCCVPWRSMKQRSKQDAGVGELLCATSTGVGGTDTRLALDSPHICARARALRVAVLRRKESHPLGNARLIAASNSARGGDGDGDDDTDDDDSDDPAVACRGCSSGSWFQYAGLSHANKKCTR